MIAAATTRLAARRANGTESGADHLVGLLQSTPFMKTCLSLAATALLAGCASPPELANHQIACGEQHYRRPASVQRDLDILLVVDTSPSMAGEASRLETNLARFVAVLETLEGGMPNLQIGVVSADVAARGGRLESAPRIAGCSSPDGAFLRDIGYANGERDANYTGPLADALACIATLPATGGDIEQPFEAAVRALDGSIPDNAGFLRDDAYLLIVFIGDEDDCSGGADFALGEPEQRSAWRCFADAVQCDQAADAPGVKTNCAVRAAPDTLVPVADYVDLLGGLKPDPRMVIVTAVTTDVADPSVSLAEGEPVLTPQCTADTAEGWPAPRVRALLDAFAPLSAAVSTCESDWSDALAILAELQATTLEGKCVPGEIDLDPALDGLQHECVVSQERYEGDTLVEEILLPACSSADPPEAERPCYHFEPDHPWCSDTPTSTWFDVLRGRESVPRGTYVHARCFTGCG